ncbi:MAG: telomerase inhibitor [Alectoria sarmentosa]|nr:MAG: telomerase inhibitor [Alectoria sarmentosa]CAD6587581.1 MAG: telomerase inhibitor [Alectoria sarmentosa]
MGLGAPKKRSKLSHDPNNTAWSRSATKYGQKILQSHGWSPGELLGASGAPYSDLLSAASASHIRITSKDDNLGLGAKIEAANDNHQATGLDVFQDLLGRLNGKSTTDLKTDTIHRSNLRCSAYIDQRWGKFRFISGGFLVGADLWDTVKGKQETLDTFQHTQSRYPENGTMPEAHRAQDVRSETSKRKKHKKRKTSADDHCLKETSSGVNWSVGVAKPPRNPRVERELDTDISPKDVYDQVRMGKVRRHAEKPERKLKRRTKRHARHSSRVQEQSILPSPDRIRLPDTSIGEVALTSHPLRETNASTQVSKGFGAGRLSVRHRYIQHKKMCMMDSKALNEILMVKA